MESGSAREAAYVLDLCDAYLCERARRQHRFDWLLGDPGADGRRVRLPVDGYWPGHKLVVAYRAEGVGEQEAAYGAGGASAFAGHKLRLAVIRAVDFDGVEPGDAGCRDWDRDLAAVGAVLERVLGVWLSDEDRVVHVFRSWLVSRGWRIVAPSDPHTDVEAEREGARLVAEAKGHTKAIGSDVDTAYGQLLRRMTDASGDVRYAVVVPSSGLWHAFRVPVRVRAMLGIDVYEVTEDGSVVVHGS